FGTFFGQLSSMILGYGLFRLTSDFEKLPFPLAPVGAQGITALAEDIEEKKDESGEKSWRWRVFSIGGALGLTFGAVYLLLPNLTGALVGKSIQILPIPFSDFTGKTGAYLPAFASGINWNLANLIFGMVMPFFGMLGGFIGLIITAVANPIMYKWDILRNWKFGDDTIVTLFKNNIDFYFSFQIGLAVAIAIVGIWQVYRSIKKARLKKREEESDTGSGGSPKGRGDMPVWVVIGCYLFVTITYISVSALLLRWHHGTWRP
ncbi:unnamed protein product, partial [marine sediment metagenome]